MAGGMIALTGLLARAADAPLAEAPAQTLPVTNTAAVPRTNTAIIPALNPGFQRKHTNNLDVIKQMKGHIDVLFMGDSITDFWRSAPPNGGKEVFEKYFGKMKVANFGIAGDTTQGVLWRLQNGEGQGYKPKVIMLMIGTNNTGGRNANTAPEIAEGIGADVAELRKDFPKAKILLLAIFPRGTPNDPVRRKIADINQRIGGLADFQHVFYLDIGAKFLDEDGKFLPGVFRTDNLHPAAPGYVVWAEAVKDPLATLMK